jgi:hypothetical protein
MGYMSELHIQMSEQLRARIDVPYQLFKDLEQQEEVEVELLKVYDPSFLDKYKKSKDWVSANEALKKAAKERSDIEDQIRVESNLNVEK